MGRLAGSSVRSTQSDGPKNAGQITLTIGTSLHFDLYVAPSGDRFTYVQTDPGSVSAVTETRVART